MTATYWQVGRHIVEFEQAGERRAGYGAQLLDRLSTDLNQRFGRGFSTDNLETMRLFYLAYLSVSTISETPSRKLLPAASDAVATDISETVSRKSSLARLAETFPLSWSHYVMLVRRSRSPEARAFYESLDNKILSAEYRLALPPEKALVAELEQTRRALEIHRAARQNRRRAKRPEHGLKPRRKP